MCSADEWEGAAANSTAADGFWQAAVGHRTSFWSDAEAVHVLCTPVIQAIEQVQQDSPLLSQLRPMWFKLTDHAMSWESSASTPPAAKRSNSVSVLMTERCGKHLHPAMSAAYLLDPIFFKAGANDGKWRSDFPSMCDPVRASPGTRRRNRCTPLGSHLHATFMHAAWYTKVMLPY
jgi:hypothetical protein